MYFRKTRKKGKLSHRKKAKILKSERNITTRNGKIDKMRINFQENAIAMLRPDNRKSSSSLLFPPLRSGHWPRNRRANSKKQENPSRFGNRSKVHEGCGWVGKASKGKEKRLKRERIQHESVCLRVGKKRDSRHRKCSHKTVEIAREEVQLCGWISFSWVFRTFWQLLIFFLSHIMRPPKCWIMKFMDNPLFENISIFLQLFKISFNWINSKFKNNSSIHDPPLDTPIYGQPLAYTKLK